MKVIVVGNDLEFDEFKTSVPDTINLIRMSQDTLISTLMADACFLLDNNTEPEIEIPSAIPVFINSVIKTRCELNLPPNISRINAWPGFLKNELWEIVAADHDKAAAILEGLGKQASCVKDVIGMVSPRIISMIINEAYYALGEEVSTKDEIDIAMKLGTNYPYGPFEWSRKIGLKNVHELLYQLSKDDSRYTPAPKMAYELER